MNVMVTGGKGFLGRYIVDELLKEGHTVVNYNRDMALPFEDPKNVFVMGELFDVPHLLEVIKKHAVDRIIHTAAQSHPEVGFEVPLATVEANVTGTTCLFEAARLSGIKRVVAFSSEVAYGDTPPGVVDESCPLNPYTPYAVTKATVEMMARAYNATYQSDFISLRVCQVYGPGQVMPEYARDAIKAAVKGKPYDLSYGIDTKMQLVYVTDAAHGAVLACFVDSHHQNVYNITGGIQVTFREVLALLERLIPGARFNVGPGTYPMEDQGLYSLEAAKKDLGYEPTVELEDGMRRYVDWLRAADY